MKTKSRIAHPSPQVESSVRHLTFVDLLVDTKTELLELAIRSGLRVFTAMLEEDRSAVCGPRYAHQPDRTATRAGTVPSEIVLGGRKVSSSDRASGPRPRSHVADVSNDGGDRPARPARGRADARGRRHPAVRAQSRAAGSEVTSRGTSKSAVSRRFVARTRAQLETWQAAPLEHLDLVALLLDGVHVGEHCLIVALGIAADGVKHALGLCEGSTENATVCQGCCRISTVGACGQTAACW